ncbi:hypothetical protein [Streptomyces sp. V1I1]|uniref:hypothetical protein n=1 Tax=Streptomyces sp. V1I1 TaxID=3042272 RepID=UPI00278A9F74|nr:hypothetical protein [Streptomyces sp. V1I1]MDQ0945673.1 hypothetical protein [Streptomyces sp. V1I1]
MRRLAAERDCTGLFAKGGEQEQSLAFHVVRQLLQPLLASYSESERREVLGDWFGIVGPRVGLSPAAERAVPDPQGVRDGLDWVTNGPEGIALLQRAVTTLELSPSSYQLAGALVELGTALRRAGLLSQAASPCTVVWTWPASAGPGVLRRGRATSWSQRG